MLPDTAAETTSLTLLVVSADPLARAALSTLLAARTDCELVNVISPAMLEGTSAGDTDWPAAVIIWDSGLDTADLQPGYFAEFGAPVVVLLSDGELVDEVLLAGAEGIVSRSMEASRIVAAAQAVAQGLLTIEASLAGYLEMLPSNTKQAIAVPLTPREIDVLQLLAEGLTNRAIASRLGISEHTVKFHVNSILGKLDAQSRTEAVVSGTRLGLIAL